MNLVFFTRLPRIGRSLAALALFGAAIAVPRLASAASITFEVPTITVTQSNADQTGYFDVTVFQTGGGSSLFQYEVDVFLNQTATNSNVSNIQFINADINTSAPYVFNGNSGEQSNNNGPFLNTPPPEAENDDSPNTNVGVALSSTMLGMERIEYDVPANSPLGSYALTFNQNTNTGDYVETTSISSSNFFLPAVVTGAINVVQSPEPTSVVLMVLGAVGLVGFGWRRARRA